jgi:stringent starvation protein B
LPEVSQLPYLLRAMLDWIVDNGWTPHLIVDARSEAVMVPRQYVTEGYIRLNISASATQAFRIGNEAVEFNARFGGVNHHIHVPIDQVMAIVARENGQGMAFRTEAPPEGETDQGGPGQSTEAVSDPVAGNPAEPPKPRRRPNLKIIK